jgi:hypothetical protein
MTSKDVTTTKQTSMTNVDISPVITEVIEYAKDQAVITDIKTVLASIPKSSSMDWKLVSGVRKRYWILIAKIRISRIVSPS